MDKNNVNNVEREKNEKENSTVLEKTRLKSSL